MHDLVIASPLIPKGSIMAHVLLRVAHMRGGAIACVLLLSRALWAEERAEARPATNLSVAGYAELFYQWNFNEPQDGITHFRGFDNRHNTFTISNAVIDAAGSIGPVSARVALQVGQTPDTYYVGDPALKLIQQAIGAVKLPLGRGLLLEGGIFLSPIGPESIPIKDQWNWSRSNLFFGLPFYHVGLRLSYPFTDRLTLAIAVWNGWNSAVDNNPEKSMMAQLTYNIADKLTWQVLYFTGVERAAGAPEGRSWRHTFDAYLTWHPLAWLSLMAHGNMGFEPNTFGTSWWGAAALYARFHPVKWMFIAIRGDYFSETRAFDGTMQAAAIFWPAGWVSSATATVDGRPYDNISLRVEYRHDHADSDMYSTANSQDTLTLGLTTWF
jgi:hypothetical protein